MPRKVTKEWKGEYMSIKDLILRKFPSEAAFAKSIGWNRQRLNKITLLKKMRPVEEVNKIAQGLGESVSRVCSLFLDSKSLNE